MCVHLADHLHKGLEIHLPHAAKALSFAAAWNPSMSNIGDRKCPCLAKLDDKRRRKACIICHTSVVQRLRPWILQVRHDDRRAAWTPKTAITCLRGHTSP